LIPRATYRLQFRKEFTFENASLVVPYLARLGVSHVYASPILAARRGLPHGYDCLPLEIKGSRRDHVVSFARSTADTSIVVATPRLCARACMESARAKLEWNEITSNQQAPSVSHRRLTPAPLATSPLSPGSRPGSTGEESLERALQFPPPPKVGEVPSEQFASEAEGAERTKIHPAPNAAFWEETAIGLPRPPRTSHAWRSIFGTRAFEAGALACAELSAEFPVAVLVAD
jgi:maltooligosyltrehalose synthase